MDGCGERLGGVVTIGDLISYLTWPLVESDLSVILASLIEAMSPFFDFGLHSPLFLWYVTDDDEELVGFEAASTDAAFACISFCSRSFLNRIFSSLVVLFTIVTLFCSIFNLMFSTRFSGISSFDSLDDDFLATRAASLASFSSMVFGVLTLGDLAPVFPSALLRGEVGGVVEVDKVSLSFCNWMFCGGVAGVVVDGVLVDSGFTNGSEGCGAGVGGVEMGSDEKSVFDEKVERGVESSELTVSESLGGALGELGLIPEMLGDRRNGTSGNSSTTDGSFVRTRKKNRIGASRFQV